MPLPIDEYERRELIDGIIYDMSPSANPYHGIINLNIATSIKTQLKDSLCKVFMENLDWHYAKDENYVVPDIMIICDIKSLHKGEYKGTPKFIVETLSPATAKKDRTIKMKLYASYGVAEYWIVSPKENAIEIYYLKDGEYELFDTKILVDDENEKEYNAADLLMLHEFPNISIPLKDIFV